MHAISETQIKMRIFRIFLLIIYTAFSFTALLFGEEYSAPKREFRGAWVATVANIDWPTAEAVGNAGLQRQEMLQILDDAARLKLNAIVFQVRPTADALYKSELEPWSIWLTGKQGQDNDTTYDPLEFVITEAHKRCIDVHVWLNPYRVTHSFKADELADTHIFKQHPEWFLKYGDKWYFDPALDETREWLNKVVADIVTRYDIDAIHFDDYFYPYRIPKKDFPDGKSFAAHPRGFTDKEAWRRNNVNMVIEELHNTIHGIKPWVEFGISPFGVWRNMADDSTRGSETQAGCRNYDDLYADILLWLENGWIDYVVPQLYWEIGKKVADYEVLAHWWSQYTYGKNLYIGLYTSQLGNRRANEAWRRPNELCRQLRLNNTIDNIDGAVHFSMCALQDNRVGIADSLSSTFYRYRALPPTNRNIQGPVAVGVDSLTIKSHTISWQDAACAADNPNCYYVVYAFPIGEKADFDNPKFIAAITADKHYEIDEPDKYSVICVTAINHYKQESMPCILKN